jgi:hypothetical protein
VIHPDDEIERLNDLREELERREEEMLLEDRAIEMAGTEGERGRMEAREWFAGPRR